MESIVEGCSAGSIPAEPVIVLSDVADAPILERARSYGIRAEYIEPGEFRTKLSPEIEGTYVEALKNAQVDYVVLAGFMRVLKNVFISAFPQRIINIHPSLLPAFPGLAAWKQALDYGVKYTGCTVHFVDEGVDSGPILGQEVVPVMPDDTHETLHGRIQAAEHRLYPAVITALARKKVVVEGRRVRFSYDA